MTWVVMLVLIHYTNMCRADKGDTVKVSGVYHLDDKQKSSVVAELTRRLSTNENTLTVGGLYKVDPETAVKARLNNTGKLAALLQHEVKPKSVLTISGEFDTKALDRPPKFGLALALRP
jgi:voltage-dependent anion channel protein 2